MLPLPHSPANVRPGFDQAGHHHGTNGANEPNAGHLEEAIRDPLQQFLSPKHLPKTLAGVPGASTNSPRDDKGYSFTNTLAMQRTSLKGTKVKRKTHPCAHEPCLFELYVQKRERRFLSMLELTAGSIKRNMVVFVFFFYKSKVRAPMLLYVDRTEARSD